MAVDAEMFKLARELQGCEVRLGLIGHEGSEGRTREMRRGLEQRRDELRERLSQLETAAGWSVEEPGDTD